jgi:hypothetical protein
VVLLVVLLVEPQVELLVGLQEEQQVVPQEESLEAQLVAQLEV